jgi:hypothetical protein
MTADGRPPTATDVQTVIVIKCTSAVMGGIKFEASKKNDVSFRQEGDMFLNIGQWQASNFHQPADQRKPAQPLSILLYIFIINIRMLMP